MLRCGSSTKRVLCHAYYSVFMLWHVIMKSCVSYTCDRTVTTTYAPLEMQPSLQQAPKMAFGAVGNRHCCCLLRTCRRPDTSGRLAKLCAKSTDPTRTPHPHPATATNGWFHRTAHLTDWSDQSLSATAAARGHVADMELVASTNSPHMHASPPMTKSCCLLVPCRPMEAPSTYLCNPCVFFCG